MLHIIQKLNKLGPLLQVAKLSVYNLSNKQVFYSGMVRVVFGDLDKPKSRRPQRAIFTHFISLLLQISVHFLKLFQRHRHLNNNQFFIKVQFQT